MTDIDEPIPAPLSLLERLKRMQKKMEAQEHEPIPTPMPVASAAQILAGLKAKRLLKRDMIWL